LTRRTAWCKMTDCSIAPGASRRGTVRGERSKRRQEKERGMSRHSSFGGSGKIKVKRNVLKRYERIDLLKAKGKWKEGDKALGLAKTKVTG